MSHPNHETAEEDRHRIDKWLWAARFFKTRSLATDEINGGKVHCNGQRVKPSRALRVGDRLEIRQGEVEKEVIVRGLSDRRGPASEAVLLYEETPASVTRREEAMRQRRESPVLRTEGRPNKQQRRLIHRFNESR
ncbi:MAG: RNA-binding S4 domain-containing protein [Magnetococcales bacterium]|nr:RNA-binding S4 domain-containing protein [Magnetococcales bacterium]NGZ25867.1 RNA-binding S4 domain-containing protein [Magnetococcales bacterium]